MDSRIISLAKRLVNYSCGVQPAEKVLISGIGQDVLPLLQQIVREVYAVGAYPYVELQNGALNREILLGCSEPQLDFFSKIELQRMQGMDAYIGVRGTDNVYELADVPQEQLQLYGRLTNDILCERVDNSKWVVLRYPNASMAQLAGMSLSRFEDFYFDVCNLDYGKMAEAMKNLQALMDKTDQVHIVGPGTDLRFSIKGMPNEACAGQRNIPDGEVFTAPIRDSVQGRITYNTPSLYEGFVYRDICLEFQDGKIIKASCNDTPRLNTVLDMDEGARYIGEFALGVNPYIIQPMLDILFDEKIMGSFHFTPGKAYESADNGNKSKLHWDLVSIQTEAYGGGQIYFDGRLIRDQGLFVLPELQCLNPENLK